MNTHPATRPVPALADSVILGRHSHSDVTEKISGLVLRERTPWTWWILFGFSSTLMAVLLLAIAALMYYGVGIWGVNVPIAWGFAIVNFVWWIGIGHAGTLISAILYLFHQEWRTSINRFAEAMTLFAVACAGLFPLLHLGRPWYFYWLLPYPNTMALWPQFRSALVFDVFAVLTYFTVSLLFWYVGLVPDMAACRDRARSKHGRMAFGLLALGWRGSAQHWQRYEELYLLLAGLATPLVVSVHTIVSFDFALALLPGWHSTVFPPYFVAGAIFSGFAMVLTLVLPVRWFYGLQDYITRKHLENMAKLTLVTSLIVGHGYLVEMFYAWYSGDRFHMYAQSNRMIGPYAWAFWLILLCNIVVPQVFWSRSMRLNPWVLFGVAQFVNVGMWLERYVIVVTSLHRDFLPSSWGMYAGTIWDWAVFLGTIGLFCWLMLLFVRLLPIISMAEMRKLLVESGHLEDGLRPEPGEANP
jgi:Ni/Fe-hydrogenase subunit HybB-like protein